MEAVLTIVGRGNAIMTEIVRLAEMVPPLYRDKQGEASHLVLDFTYFKNVDTVETRIERDDTLSELDGRMKEEYLATLTRFYQCFESIQQYGLEVVQFVEDLEGGKFIQQNLDTLLRKQDGRQLLAEAVYLLGVILLTTDRLLPGLVRERLLVSYYRYSGQAGHTAHFDIVCDLLRPTGYTTQTKRPVGYPESLFSRIPLQTKVVTRLVGLLRSEDLYCVLPHYPETRERTTGLATQAAMLFVILYFQPDILKSEKALMREIVDKYFGDNWVISIYMGSLVWLPEAWEPYRAAREALTNTTATAEVKRISSLQGSIVSRVRDRLRELLTEGRVGTQEIMGGGAAILGVVRESNVTLRWLLLHTAPLPPSVVIHKRTRQLWDIVRDASGIKDTDLFGLLLQVSSLEEVLKQMYNTVLEERGKSWDKLKEDCVSRMSELVEVFSGRQQLSRVLPSKKLEAWIRARSNQMSALTLEDPGQSARTAVLLIQALEDAKQFHQLESNLQVTQYLQETKDSLLAMVQLTQTQEDVLVQLQILSDFSYAWQLIHNLTPLMQEQVRCDPSSVCELRSTFLKLSGAMEVAMVRLCQAHTKDLVPVSQYYSRTLVTYIRNVLQVIPATMFSLLETIVHLHSGLQDLPTRLDKDKLKEFSQLDQRFEIARLTHQVSILSRAVLSMQTTLVGVLQVDPKQLLEEGIRRELVSRLGKAFHDVFTFNTKTKDRVGELETRLAHMGSIVEGYRRSFEYIQDYINIPGLRLWQEEVSRIVNHAVEREAAGFLKGSGDHYSQYQSVAVPIPEFPPGEGSLARTFLGRLASELLSISGHTHTVYVESSGAWYGGRAPHTQVLGPSLSLQLELVVGIPGLAGLDRLMGLMLVTRLHALETWLMRELSDDRDLGRLLTAAREILRGQTVTHPGKTYSSIQSRLGKNLTSVHTMVSDLGHLTQVRNLLLYRLSSTATTSCPLLHSSLCSIQSSLVTAAQDSRVAFPPEQGESELLAAVVPLTQWVGLDHPSDQVYLSLQHPPTLLPLLLCLLTLHSTLRSSLSTATGFLLSRRLGEMDGWVYLSGLGTLLTQCHPQVKKEMVTWLEQAQASFTLATEIQEAKNIQEFLHALSQMHRTSLSPNL